MSEGVAKTVLDVDALGVAGQVPHCYCSFCAKSDLEVAKLFAAATPNVFMCNECVDFASEILRDEGVPVTTTQPLTEATVRRIVRDEMADPAAQWRGDVQDALGVRP